MSDKTESLDTPEVYKQVGEEELDSIYRILDEAYRMKVEYSEDHITMANECIYRMKIKLSTAIAKISSI